MVSLYLQQVQGDLFSQDAAINPPLSSKNSINIHPRERVRSSGPPSGQILSVPLLILKNKKNLPLEFFHLLSSTKQYFQDHQYLQ